MMLAVAPPRLGARLGPRLTLDANRNDVSLSSELLTAGREY
jgi:hypothetical protein